MDEMNRKTQSLSNGFFSLDFNFINHKCHHLEAPLISIYELFVWSLDFIDDWRW